MKLKKNKTLARVSRKPAVIYYGRRRSNPTDWLHGATPSPSVAGDEAVGRLAFNAFWQCAAGDVVPNWDQLPTVGRLRWMMVAKTVQIHESKRTLARFNDASLTAALARQAVIAAHAVTQADAGAACGTRAPWPFEPELCTQAPGHAGRHQALSGAISWDNHAAVAVAAHYTLNRARLAPSPRPKRK